VRSRSWSLLVVTVVALVGALAAFACSSGDDGEEMVASRIEVTATEFAFQPAEIRMKAQQHYEISLRNDGQVLHDWRIDEIPATDVSRGSSDEHGMEGMEGTATAGGMMMLDLAAEPGKSADMSFTPTRPGEYVFYCTVPGHREVGMEGTLMVEQ